VWAGWKEGTKEKPGVGNQFERLCGGLASGVARAVVGARWLAGGYKQGRTYQGNIARPLFDNSGVTGFDRTSAAQLRVAWLTLQAKIITADNGIVSLDAFRGRKVAMQRAA
jgi:hypothetical protein